VPGRLEKLLVNIGDKVNNGDLIALLDSEEYAQQVAAARAELEVSQANLADSKSALDIAQRDYERSKELLQQKIASPTQLDQALAEYNAAKAKLEVAEAQIKQRQAALRTAEVRLSYTRIHASWDDQSSQRIVAERFVDEGSMLRANDPVVSIVDISTVKAIINVVEEDFPDIRVGQETTITTDAYGDRKFTGKVARRAPVLEEESRQARVEVEIPNPDRLLAPGMFVRATIQFDIHDDVTVVPGSALVRRNGDRGVFLADLENNSAKFIPVQTGIVDGEWVEIVEPELEGQVVTLGQHLLEDGASIVVSRTTQDEDSDESQENNTTAQE
jgi:RND family efflux transporter MFP subunit